MKGKQLVLVLLICCAVAVIGAGCGDSNGAATTAAPDGTDEPTTTAADTALVEEKVIVANEGWDIDADLDGVDEAEDLLWEQSGEEEWYLVPQNGAQAAVIIGVSFDSLGLTEAQAATFSADALSAQDNDDVVAEGSVLVVRTSEGNFAKILVEGFEPNEDSSIEKYSIVLQYVLVETE